MNTGKGNELFIQIKGVSRFCSSYRQENKAQPYQPCILGFLQSWGETDVFTFNE